MWYRSCGKRLLDLLGTALLLLPALALAFPVLLISGIVFRGKIFFMQKRLGYQNKVFTIYKLTTLLPQGAATQDPDNRQNAWGKFLRDYSLDELPQLLNILKGDMSFVGPRPLLPEYRPLYTPEEARRHEVKPGLSGLAQVNGRNALSWEEKMDFDQQYVGSISFWLDVKILCKTFVVALRGQEINHGGAPKPKPLEWVNA